MSSLKLCIALLCLLFIQIDASEKKGAARTCPDHSLPCNDGDCVRREKWCDVEEEINCKDESDEAYCNFAGFFRKNPNECKSTHFLCDTGQCVPFEAQCDGFDDCKDNSDERNCKPKTTDGNLLTKAPTVIKTEATTTDATTESSELENGDFISSTQTSPQVFTQISSHAFTKNTPLYSSTQQFYAKRIEEDSIQTDVPHPTKPSTTTPKALTVTDLKENQVVIQSITSSKPLPPATLPTKASESRRSSSAPILTSKIQSFDSRRQPLPSLTSTTQPQRPYQAIYHTQPSSSIGRINTYQHHTEIPSYLAAKRTPPFQHQTRPTIPHDARRESYHYSTQASRSSASRKVDQNQVQPLRSHETKTDTYQHQTQPLRPQESSRISASQQRNQPTSYDTRQQPYDTRQQPYDTKQPYDSRQQPHDPRRSSDQSQSHRSGLDAFRGQPTVPVRQSQYPYHETIGEINGFRILRIYSSDGQRFYDGYYNQTGYFTTLNTDQRRQPNANQNPIRRTWPQPSTISTAAPLIYDGKLKVPSRFYFAKNYTRDYGQENAEYIQRGRYFILSIRDTNGGWGKETPRALIALSLINNSFVTDTYENNIMQKYFQVFLGTSLIRGEAKTTSINRLAMSVNALIATCQNPRDFHGTDYTELIRNRLREQRRETREESANPFVYLSLCLADRNLEHHEVYDLMTRLQSHDTQDEFEQDKQIMAISAFTCLRQQQKSMDPSPSEYQRSMDSLLRNATLKLLNRMREDGSFGSVYSTAIATQALMSVNDTRNWSPELTFDFLKRHQHDNGSFGDFLSTYLVLPALSGRSLLHLRNTQCTPPNIDRALTPSEILEYRGPKHHVRYSLYMGYPKTNGYSIEVLVPKGISFFDIMRVAAHQNDAFKFSYEERNGGIYVYSISNIPNDSERGLEWNLYVKLRFNFEVDNPSDHESILGDIRKFYPRSDQHVIFWYKPSDTWT